MEVLTSQAIIDSHIIHDEFALINNVLKEYDKMKEEIKNLKTHQRFQSIYKTLLLHCLKCRKYTNSKNPKVARTKNGRIMLLSKCQVYDSKKLTFIKDQDASGLLSNLEIMTTLSKIPLLGPLLFQRY